MSQKLSQGQAILLGLVVVFVVVNLFVDLSYSVIDPRIRHGSGGQGGGR